MRITGIRFPYSGGGQEPTKTVKHLIEPLVAGVQSPQV